MSIALKNKKAGIRKLSIQYGEIRISFQLEQTERKTLAISVHPDMTVEVKAPEKAKLSDIKERVQKKAPWILKQQREFETYLPAQPNRKYVSGETFRYLGKQYRLKVIKNSETRELQLKRGYLELHLTGKPDKATIKNAVEDWFRLRGKQLLTDRFLDYLKRTKLKLPHEPALEIRKMKTRWGSCTKEGKIILNPELVHVPTRCIDYVIAHELCHVIEHNHSKRFYDLLDREMPGWRNVQGKLNASAAD